MARTVPSLMLSVIEERGWWRGEESEETPKQCPVSSIYYFDASRDDVSQAYDVISQVIGELYPGPWTSYDCVQCITHWNDAPETKITHVRKVLREASRRLRSA